MCNSARGNPEALDIFRAKLVAHDPTAQAIYKIIEKCGLTIQFHPQQNHPTLKRPPRAIWAIAAVQEIYARGKEELLEEVLTLASLSWINDGHALESKVLLGIMDFHLKYQGRYTREEFIDKMNITDLNVLRRRAQYHAENHGGSMRKTFMRALQEAYDRQRRTRRLEPKEA